MHKVRREALFSLLLLWCMWGEHWCSETVDVSDTNDLGADSEAVSKAHAQHVRSWVEADTVKCCGVFCFFFDLISESDTCFGWAVLHLLYASFIFGHIMPLAIPGLDHKVIACPGEKKSACYNSLRERCFFFFLFYLLFFFVVCLIVFSWRPASPQVFSRVEDSNNFVEFLFSRQYCCSIPSILAILNIHYLLPLRHCMLSVSLILLTFCSVIQCHSMLVLPSISLRPCPGI